MTHRQRLAWAKDHGVTPPSFATASVTSEAEMSETAEHKLASSISLDGHRQAVGTKNSKNKKCCSPKSVAAKQAPTCCIDGVTDRAEDSGARAKTDNGNTVSSCCTDDQKDQANTLVLQALKCRGAASGFVNLPWYKLYQNSESLLACRWSECCCVKRYWVDSYLEACGTPGVIRQAEPMDWL